MSEKLYAISREIGAAQDGPYPTLGYLVVRGLRGAHGMSLREAEEAKDRLLAVAAQAVIDKAPAPS